MKLSIIIPCYNAEEFIERCVNSIIEQKDHALDLEILLCNDGSKDNTLKIIQGVQSKHPDIVKIDAHENMGVYKTRNRALDLVTGDFIWLIDADDEIKPNSLNLIENELTSNPEILSFGYLIEGANKKFIEICPPQIESPTDGINYLNHNDGRLFLWSNIYSNSFIQNNNLRFLGKSMSLEDSFFNIQAFTNAKRVIMLKEIIYIYYFNDGSISKKSTLENRLKQGESSINVHLAWKDYKETFIKETEIIQTLDYQLDHSVLGFLFSLVKEGYPISYIKKVLKLYKEKGLYPIRNNKNFNYKAKAFRILANKRNILLLLAYVRKLL